MNKKEETLRQLRTDVVLNRRTLEALEEKASKFKKLDDTRRVQETLVEIKSFFSLYRKNLEAIKKTNKNEEVSKFIKEIQEDLLKKEKELIRIYDDE